MRKCNCVWPSMPTGKTCYGKHEKYWDISNIGCAKNSIKWFQNYKGIFVCKTQQPNDEPKTCTYIHVLKYKEMILPLVDYKDSETISVQVMQCTDTVKLKLMLTCLMCSHMTLRLTHQLHGVQSILKSW
jgi:hypothetical protein